MIINLILCSPFVSLLVAYEGNGNTTSFCDRFPTSYYCKTEDLAFDHHCGLNVTNVLSNLIDEVDFVKVVNNMRVELANGQAKLGNLKFDQVGDMVEVEWNRELEKVAISAIRHCHNGTLPFEIIIVPSLENDKIYSLMYNITLAAKIEEKKFIKEALNKWKEIELQLLQNISNGWQHTTIFKFLLYGKHRFIGCGRVSFSNEEEETQWKMYILCLFSPGGVESDIHLLKLGQRPCSACPVNTSCTPSRYSGVLCAWGIEISAATGEAEIMAASNPFLASLLIACIYLM